MTSLRDILNNLVTIQFQPPTNVRDELGIDYDSEDAVSEAESDEGSVEGEEVQSQHSDPNSYAWAILRLALVKQIIYRLQQFLSLCGQDTSGMQKFDFLINMLS